MRHTSDCPWYIGRGGACTCGPEPTEPKPAPEPLDPKDYEIMCLKLRNAQMHRRIAVLEQQLKETAQDPWIAGEGEV